MGYYLGQIALGLLGLIGGFLVLHAVRAVMRTVKRLRRQHVMLVLTQSNFYFWMSYAEVCPCRTCVYVTRKRAELTPHDIVDFGEAPQSCLCRLCREHNMRGRLLAR